MRPIIDLMFSAGGIAIVLIQHSDGRTNLGTLAVAFLAGAFGALALRDIRRGLK